MANLFGVSPQTMTYWFRPRDHRDIPGDDVMPKLAELSGHDLNQLRLFKRLVKMSEEGIDLSYLDKPGRTLTPDQDQVLELMDSDDYVAAAQFLLQLSRLSA